MLVAGAAHAQRIVLVLPPSGDPMLSDAHNRLKAELALHQFDVDSAEAPLGAEPAPSLTRMTRERDALAGIALVSQPSESAVQIWLVDRMSGKATMRTVTVDPTGDAASLLAIRAVDLLRASLKEYESADAPPPDIANVDRRAKPVAVRKLTAERPPVWALHAAAVLLHEHPHLGFGWGPAMGASYRIRESVRAGLRFVGPVTGMRFNSSRGFASIRQEFAFVELQWEMLQLSRARLGIRGLVGLAFLQAQGQPQPPLTGVSDNLWGSLWGGGFGAEMDMTSRVAIELALCAMGTTPRLGVALLDEQTTVGIPILMSSLGLKVEL